jgi:hypothetical protein
VRCRNCDVPGRAVVSIKLLLKCICKVNARYRCRQSRFHMQASSFWWFLSLCGHRDSRTLELNKITCERCRVLNSLYQSGMRRKAREAEAVYQGHRGRRNIGEIAGTTSANLGDRLRSRAIGARPGYAVHVSARRPPAYPTHSAMLPTGPADDALEFGSKLGPN